MKIKRIEHIAIAVKSMAQTREIFEEKLGLKLEYEEYLPQYHTRLAMYPIGSTYLELLESDRHDTETSRWIAERGEGLFHICLEVEAIDEALDELKGKGVKLTTSSHGSDTRIPALLSLIRNRQETSSSSLLSCQVHTDDSLQSVQSVMSTVVPANGEIFNTQVPLLIIGAGAAGLCAALTAKEAGTDVVVVERDATPTGSTALSAGLIPAAGTKFQRAKGISDSPQRLAGDITRKAKGEADPAVVDAVAQAAAPLIEWLAEHHSLPFEVLDNFNYPGHFALRMHGLPSRTGRELIDRLRNAAEANDIVILTRSAAKRLMADSDGRILGVEVVRGDGKYEWIGCGALILACNGFGGDPELVRRYIPEMATALYFGHGGNCGDAVMWGGALGAQLMHLGAYQGHGSVATPHNILISWAVIMQGGIQINREGRRFSDETRGYSEQAAEVLRQPGGSAWNVFDARIAAVARQFEDFRDAERAGAIMTFDTIAELAQGMHVPAATFAAEWNEVEKLKSAGGQDRYGRKFLAEQSCKPPYHAVKVTGALFHTQGGLAVDTSGRVRRADGTTFPNLFAAGGAAVGVSGSTAAGYLSGNGLLTATVLGHLAGKAAAKQLMK